VSKIAPSILIVDDEPDDRALARHEACAVYPDAEIVEAGTRAEFEAAMGRIERGADHAGEASAGRPFDLVVTDLALKWSTGREVLERVRLAGSTPVVMFTDSGDEITAVDLIKAGLDDYVVKSARQLPRLRASIRLAVETGQNRAALTEREAQLQAALNRSRTVVRELHHRVKNNLQVITSLLTIEARGADDANRARLQQLAGRMQALAAVQTRIYETGDLDEVDFAAALTDIGQILVDVYGGGRVTLARDDDGPCLLPVARAMPLGLLCYEIILNAVKHGFPDGRHGAVVVELRSAAEPNEVRIRDDGVGFAEGEVAKGLGSRVARALAREAGAKMHVLTLPGSGTTVTLKLTGSALPADVLS
jgi:two-component sensor histidine kinase